MRELVGISEALPMGARLAISNDGIVQQQYGDNSASDVGPLAKACYADTLKTSQLSQVGIGIGTTSSRSGSAASAQPHTYTQRLMLIFIEYIAHSRAYLSNRLYILVRSVLGFDVCWLHRE